MAFPVVCLFPFQINNGFARVSKRVCEATQLRHLLGLFEVQNLVVATREGTFHKELSNLERSLGYRSNHLRGIDRSPFTESFWIKTNQNTNKGVWARHMIHGTGIFTYSSTSNIKHSCKKIYQSQNSVDLEPTIIWNYTKQLRFGRVLVGTWTGSFFFAVPQFS